jgi:hypothetical protein
MSAPDQANPAPAFTVAETGAATIRAFGQARCACGHIFQAGDFKVADADDVRLICPRCHCDIFEISR